MTTGDELPFADRLEQETELDPDEEERAAAERLPQSGDPEAPEADLAEQSREFPVDEDGEEGRA